jgi:hypothetical protein
MAAHRPAMCSSKKFSKEFLGSDNGIQEPCQYRRVEEKRDKPVDEHGSPHHFVFHIDISLLSE